MCDVRSRMVGVTKKCIGNTGTRAARRDEVAANLWFDGYPTPTPSSCLR